MVVRALALFALGPMAGLCEPVLSVDKSSLSWTGTQAVVLRLYQPHLKSISVSNAGDGTLRWTLASSNDPAGKHIKVRSYTGTVSCSGGDNAVLNCAGTNNATLHIGWSTWATSPILAAGLHSATLTFTNMDTGAAVAVTVTLSVVPRATNLTVQGRWAEAGCKTSNPIFGAEKDTCLAPMERPPSLLFPLPLKGAAYTDPNFGGTVKILTGPRTRHSYSSLGAFNAEGTKAIVSEHGGYANVIRTWNGTNERTNVNGSDTWRLWSSTDPDLFYYASGTKLCSYAVSTGAAVEVRDFAGTVQALVTGGQADLSKDNWLPFYSPSDAKVCAYDIPNNNLYCADYGGGSPAIVPNYVLISKGVDAISGKRYVVLGGTPASYIFSVDLLEGDLDPVSFGIHDPGKLSGAYPVIDFDYSTTCATGCVRAAHDDTVEDASGVQYLVRAAYFENPNVNAVVALRFNSGQLMAVPAELGGGLHWLHNYQWGSGISVLTQAHVSCARRAPYCVLTTGIKPGNVNQGATTSYTIAGATNDPEIRITTGQPHSFVAGDAVNIGGVQGCAAANGVWTVQSVPDNTHFTIDRSGAGGGACVPDTGAVSSGAGYARKSYGGEVMVYGLASLTSPSLLRVAMNRSIPYTNDRDGTSFGYASIPKGSISQDGSAVLFDSNFGEPTQFRVALAETGIGVRMALKQAAATTQEAVIHYRSADGAPCVRETSATGAFTGAGAADVGPYRDRFWHLTAWTSPVYWRLTCGAETTGGALYATELTPGATTEIPVKLSAPPVPGAANVRIRWGYGPEMSEPAVARPCQGQCTVLLPVISGRVVHLDWTWRDAALNELTQPSAPVTLISR